MLRIPISSIDLLECTATKTTETKHVMIHMKDQKFDFYPPTSIAIQLELAVYGKTSIHYQERHASETLHANAKSIDCSSWIGVCFVYDKDTLCRLFHIRRNHEQIRLVRIQVLDQFQRVLDKLSVLEEEADEETLSKILQAEFSKFIPKSKRAKKRVKFHETVKNA